MNSQERRYLRTIIDSDVFRLLDRLTAFYEERLSTMSPFMDSVSYFNGEEKLINRTNGFTVCYNSKTNIREEIDNIVTWRVEYREEVIHLNTSLQFIIVAKNTGRFFIDRDGSGQLLAFGECYMLINDHRCYCYVPSRGYVVCDKTNKNDSWIQYRKLLREEGIACPEEMSYVFFKWSEEMDNDSFSSYDLIRSIRDEGELYRIIDRRITFWECHYS